MTFETYILKKANYISINKSNITEFIYAIFQQNKKKMLSQIFYLENTVVEERSFTPVINLTGRILQEEELYLNLSASVGGDS